MKKLSRGSNRSSDVNKKAEADQDHGEEAQHLSNLEASANDAALRDTQHKMGNAQH